MGKTSFSSIDPKELDHFTQLAQSWWDEQGDFKTLHQLNPTRIQFILSQVRAHFEIQANKDKPLTGLHFLDIGCGGGLLSEPMARLGAKVTGIDAVPQNIEIAERHAEVQQLNIIYRATVAEQLKEEKASFDVVLGMEIIEHVACVPEFIKTCRRLVKPKGMLILSTLNQTIKSFLLGIVGAEYILRWVPRGTHQWRKFVRPRDLGKFLELNGFIIKQQKGIHYNLMHKSWEMGDNLSVNYMISAVKKENA